MGEDDLANAILLQTAAKEQEAVGAVRYRGPLHRDHIEHLADGLELMELGILVLGGCLGVLNPDGSLGTDNLEGLIAVVVE